MTWSVCHRIQSYSVSDDLPISLPVNPRKVFGLSVELPNGYFRPRCLLEIRQLQGVLTANGVFRRPWFFHTGREESKQMRGCKWDLLKVREREI
jgi:hypothetical protein